MRRASHTKRHGFGLGLLAGRITKDDGTAAALGVRAFARASDRFWRSIGAVLLSAVSLAALGSIGVSTATAGAAGASEITCIPALGNCAPQNVNFIQQGSFNLAGTGFCGIIGHYAPLASAAIDSNDDDPLGLNGTNEGNYTNREAFRFQPATTFGPGDTMTVALPHPTEPYSNSGSILPAVQVPSGLSSEATASTVQAFNVGPGETEVEVTIPNAGSTTNVRLDAYNPYQAHNLQNAPGPNVSGSGTSANIQGFETTNSKFDNGQTSLTFDNFNGTGSAFFDVTDGSAEDVVFGATDVTSSNHSNWVGILQTAEYSFNGGTASPSGACASDATSPTFSQASDGFTYILDVNGVAHLIPQVAVTQASGNESATLTVPPGVPGTTPGNDVTLYVFDAVSPPGEGTPSHPLSGANTPYPPDAFSISTSEDPVPGFPNNAPVFQADASNQLPAFPVDNDNSTLTSSTASAEVGAGTGNSVTATATLRDFYNNAVNQTQVSISALSTASHASVAPQTPPTNTANPTTGNDGTVAYSVSDSCAEQVVLTGTDTDDNVPVGPFVLNPNPPPLVTGTELPVTFTAAPSVPPDGTRTLATCGKTAVISQVSTTVGTNTTISSSSSSPSQAPADGTSAATVNVTLGDQFGNADSCHQVQLIPASQTFHATVTAEDPTNPCPGKNLPGYSGTDGVATFQVTDATAETVALSVADTTEVSVWPSNPASNGPDVARIQFEGADTGQSTVQAASPTAPADGQPADTVTVTLNDAGGQPLQGKAVSLVGCSNNPTPPTPCNTDAATTITAVNAVTNGSGQAVFEVGDNVVGDVVNYQATDTTDGVTVNQTATVTYTAGGASLSASPSTVLADGTGTTSVTFTLEDTTTAPIANVPVTLSANPSTGAVITPTGANDTGTNGTASWTVSDTHSGQVTLTAKATYASPPTACVGALQGSTCTVTALINVNFVNPPASFTISPSPATNVPSDGISSSQVMVTALDAHGNPVVGVPIALESTGSAQVTPTSSTTNGQGNATFSVTDTTAETVTLTAEYGEIGSTPSITKPGSATVQFVKTEAEQSSITPTSASAPADGTSTVTLTVTLVGGSGTPINGHSVFLETDFSSTVTVRAPVGNPGAVTNGSGQVTFTITDTKPESVTIYAHDLNDGTIVNVPAIVTFTPTEVQTDSITSNSPQPAGGPPGQPLNVITVTVSLGAGASCQANNVGNVIKLTSPSGTATISGPTATGPGGTALFSVTDTVPETLTLTATDQTCGKTLANNGTVTFSATEANQSSVAVNPANTPASGAGATFAVTLRTGTGSPIIGELVTGSVLSGHATVTPEASSTGGTPGVTNSQGVALFVVTDSTVEQVTLGAFDGATELYQTATLNVTGSQANQSSIVAVPPSVPAIGATTTVTVTLLTGGDLPIVGDSVSLSASSSTVSISPAIATTASGGKASFTVSDSQAESVVLTALDRTTGVTLVPTVTVVFTANEQNQSTITTSATAVQAKKTATITVTLLGPTDTPLAGHTVKLTTTPSANVTVTPITKNGVTTSAGVAQFSVSSSTTQSVVIGAMDTTAGVTLYKTVSVTWVKP